MDNNARLNRTKLVDEFFESEGTDKIPWPAKSPDFDPIENLRDYLGRAIARRHPPPSKCSEDGIAGRVEINSPNCD